MCLSASISLESLDRSSRNFLCRSPVAVARSSSGGVAIRYYALPVLWMTSRLVQIGRSGPYGASTTNGVAIPGRGLMSMNVLLMSAAVLGAP